MVWLHNRCREMLGIEVFPGQDIKVRGRRVTADICVTLGEPDEQSSRAHRSCASSIIGPMAKQWRRIAEYLDFGVPNGWQFDPHQMKAMVWPEDGILRTGNPDIALPLAGLL